MGLKLYKKLISKSKVQIIPCFYHIFIRENTTFSSSIFQVFFLQLSDFRSEFLPQALPGAGGLGFFPGSRLKLGKSAEKIFPKQK